MHAPYVACKCPTILHVKTTHRVAHFTVVRGWLGSWVVSELDSGVEGPGFKLQPQLSGNSLRQTVHTHCASVHQAAKLVAALLMVTGVTAGLAESNGSPPPGLWLTSPAGWLTRTGISSGTLRSVIEYGLPSLEGAWVERQEYGVHLILASQSWGIRKQQSLFH